MAIPLPRPRLCVFDLDGTLVDSLRDIGESLNHCLTLLGLPTHPIERYRYMVGEGVPRLCQRAASEAHPHLVERLAELVRPHYRTRVLHHTRPYPGVLELVECLRADGIPLAVLSNKPHELTTRIVEHFWPEGQFTRIHGYIDEHLRKPSPHYLLRLCEAFGTAPQETWLVGDTPTDVQTAHAAGAYSVSVTWGFRTRKDLMDAGASVIIDTPDQLW